MQRPGGSRRRGDVLWKILDGLGEPHRPSLAKILGVAIFHVVQYPGINSHMNRSYLPSYFWSIII
ncbi:hypothetical protein CDEF62S_05517 [Castellaniella defragrans]